MVLQSQPNEPITQSNAICEVLLSEYSSAFRWFLLTSTGMGVSILFMIELSRSLNVSSIKVYLSGIHSLWIRDATMRLGFEGNYLGHNFRIEAATPTASVGIPDHLSDA